MNDSQLVTPARKRSMFIAYLAFLLSIVALLFSTWQWYTNQQRLSNTQHELAQRLASESDTNKTLRAMIDQNVNASHALQGRIAVLEGRLNESADQYAGLNTMYQDLTKNRADWMLSEAEHSLTIADQQLKLYGNIPSAITALEMTQARLNIDNRPELTLLKKTLSQDIARLKALPYTNPTDINAKLDQLGIMIDSLPLTADRASIEHNGTNTPPSTTTRSWWERSLAIISQSLGEMIQIKRLDRPEAALLSPEQSFFLRENMKMRLLNAKLALIQRDAKTYQHDLLFIQTQIQHYFDQNAPLSQEALRLVDDIKNPALEPIPSNVLSSIKIIEQHTQIKQGGKP